MKKFIAVLAVVMATALVSLTSTSYIAAAKEKPVAEKSVKKSTKKVSKKAILKSKKKQKYLKVQTALNKHGAKLKVDGRWGRKSRAALVSFQKSKKLKPTGRLNKITLAKLGV